MQIFEEYACNVGEHGLSLEGMCQVYADGNADIERDFGVLGLSLVSCFL